MKADQYISSGILELYVAGVLSAEEAQEVRSMANKYPEVLEAIEGIEENFGKYAATDAPPLRADLKAEIEEKIRVIEEDVPVVQLPEVKRSRFVMGGGYRWLAAASIVMILGSAICDYYFYTQWKTAEGSLASLQNEKQQFAVQFQQTSLKLNEETASLQDAQHQISVYSDTSYKKIMLPGTSDSKNSMAMVYWNPSKKELYLKVKDLPMPPTGKQYQLWAIVNGTPVDAGVFQMDTAMGGMAKMKDIASAQMFAITLEPMGGSATPTMPIYVAGKPG